MYEYTPEDIVSAIENACAKDGEDFIKFGYDFDMFVGYFGQWFDGECLPVNVLRAEWDKLVEKFS